MGTSGDRSVFIGIGCTRDTTVKSVDGASRSSSMPAGSVISRETHIGRPTGVLTDRGPTR